MRLIDADALEEELKKDIMGGLNYRWYINNAPTVVVLEQIRDELHATAEMHEDGDYYLRDEWIDEYFDKYTKGE